MKLKSLQNLNKFTQEQEVLPDHLDDLKHVNNIQYLNWIQEISKKHWNKLITKRKFEFQIWIVRSHNIVYKKRAKLGNELLLETYVKECKNYTSERTVNVLQKKNLEVIAQCKTTWCYVNKISYDLERIPKEVKELLTFKDIKY